MEYHNPDLTPEAENIFIQIKTLSAEDRRNLLTALNISFGNENIHSDPPRRSEETLESLQTPEKKNLTPQAHLLSFTDLTDDKKPLSILEIEEIYKKVQEDVKPDEYCLSWGFKPDRKRLGVPDKIFQINHAFGTESDPKSDTCLVGYWFVWKNGPVDELTAEIYRLPNKAVSTNEKLVHLIAQVAPDWFGKQKPEEGFDSESGFTAPLNPGPPSRRPGHSQEIPVTPADVVFLVGETRVHALRNL